MEYEKWQIYSYLDRFTLASEDEPGPVDNIIATV